jgi:hypothetical protein
LEIKNNLIPEIVSQYNSFYNTNYSLNNLSDEYLFNSVKDLIKLTLTGDEKLYRGIDETTKEKIYNAYSKLALENKIDIEDYTSVPDEMKRKLWLDVKNNQATIIMQSRTDLISQIIANNSLNRVTEALAKIEEPNNLFVGAITRRDERVRDDHSKNDLKYWNTKTYKPYLDVACRCLYTFGSEEFLKSLGYNKLR